MLLLTLCLLASGPAAAERPSPSLCSRYGDYMSCVKRQLSQPPVVPRGVYNLNLNWNNISRIEKSSFSWTDDLHVLSVGIQDGKRLSVGAEAFWNLPNLTDLDLGGNIRLELALEAFAGLAQLQILHLDYNGLHDSVLQKGYFRDLVSLQTLVLEGNQLQHIRPDPTFLGLRSLLVVDFTFNQIRQICEGDLRNIQHRFFKRFDISRNRYLYADTSFSWDNCGNPFLNILLYTLDLSETTLGVQQLQKMFVALRGTLIIELKLQHFSFGSSFGYSNLPDINNQTLAGLADSSLMTLDLSHGFLSSLRRGVFAHLASLKMLKLSFNRVHLIERDAFLGLGSLLQLNLSSNLLGEIYSWTFEGLRNVSLIDLHHNHIGIIQFGSFGGLPHLVTLDLRDNSLSAIPGLPQFSRLQYFFLGWNRLDSVFGLEAFAASTFLDFSNNLFTDLQVLYEIMGLPAVTHLLLKENRLSRCTVPSTATVPRGNRLLHLDLSSNFLQLMWEAAECRDVFHHLGNLTDLLLQQNYLTELPGGVFKGLVSLKRLNLSLNSLTRLSRDLLPASLEILDLSGNRLVSPDPDTFGLVRQLDLRGNQYICDCKLNPFLRWLNKTQVELVGPLTQMSCALPEELRGEPLTSLPLGCGVEHIQFALFVSLTTLLVIFMTSVLLYTRCSAGLCLGYRALTRAVLGGSGKNIISCCLQ